jgi:hypothetical protein
MARGIQLRFGAQVSPVSLGLAAREPRCCKRSDQLPQGVARLPPAPGVSLSAVVDAVGGDPGVTQQPRSVGRD